mmetsp:Transcript_39444/g.71068  ORF Transcript_39444/g.71068 Transcript_39444/m.71068 type:complete len:219 (-) Transcript_39444:735-1391(-)
MSASGVSPSAAALERFKISSSEKLFTDSASARTDPSAPIRTYRLWKLLNATLSPCTSMSNSSHVSLASSAVTAHIAPLGSALTSLPFGACRVTFEPSPSSLFSMKSASGTKDSSEAWKVPSSNERNLPKLPWIATASGFAERPPPGPAEFFSRANVPHFQISHLPLECTKASPAANARSFCRQCCRPVVSCPSSLRSKSAPSWTSSWLQPTPSTRASK